MVTNGGSTLLQAIACGAACVAVPIAGDQIERIRRCVARAAAVDGRARCREHRREAACALLHDEPARAALAQRAAGSRARRRHRGRVDALDDCSSRRSEGGRCMPNAVLLGYDLDQPSFRHRMRSLVAPLRRRVGRCAPERFPSGRYGLRTWERRGLLRMGARRRAASDQAERPRGALVCRAQPAARIRRGRCHLCAQAAPARRAGRTIRVWRRRKFAATCRSVDVVAAGNEVLAAVARAAARAVEILPTSIDTSCYRATHRRRADAPRPSSGSAVRRTWSTWR